MIEKKLQEQLNNISLCSLADSWKLIYTFLHDPVQTYKRCARGGRQPTTVYNNDHPEGFQSTSIHFLPKGLTFKPFWVRSLKLSVLPQIYFVTSFICGSKAKRVRVAFLPSMNHNISKSKIIAADEVYLKSKTGVSKICCNLCILPSGWQRDFWKKKIFQQNIALDGKKSEKTSSKIKKYLEPPFCTIQNQGNDNKTWTFHFTSMRFCAEFKQWCSRPIQPSNKY